MNETHDPELRSWVESANRPGSDFPIQNLPFGVMLRPGFEQGRIAVAIGESALDLAACAEAGLLSSLDAAVARSCESTVLNPLMALPIDLRSALRRRISQLLRSDNGEIRGRSDLVVPLQEIRMMLPASIGDYTDFYASIHHATRVGSLFRPDNPLLPNYKYVPIGYHGRSSSIVVSGTTIRRPRGQTRKEGAPPEYGISRMLDYEFEAGFFIGAGNPLGRTISIEHAEEHIFGICLVNDWSARDIQSWEYQPLGPFLAKNFATSISPWIVTMEALEPFRGPAQTRLDGDPPPLPYLSSPRDQSQGAIRVTLEASVQSPGMTPPQMVSRTNLDTLYWTPSQLVTHHASNGCNLRTGDLLASGTVSGPSDTECGCLLELTRRGQKPLQLENGESRTFLEDGDSVHFTGYCERDGWVRIGLGSCSGKIEPA